MILPLFSILLSLSILLLNNDFHGGVQFDFTPVFALAVQSGTCRIFQFAPLHIRRKFADVMISMLEYNTDAALQQVHKHGFTPRICWILVEFNVQTARTKRDVGFNMLIFRYNAHSSPLLHCTKSNRDMVTKC